MENWMEKATSVPTARRVLSTPMACKKTYCDSQFDTSMLVEIEAPFTLLENGFHRAALH